MDKFTTVELKLNKNVKKGTKESLTSLFSFRDRVKRMEVLTDMEEGRSVKAVLEGLGEAELVLGNDMEKGQQKTIMTLFWMPEKTKPVEMKRDAKEGEMVVLNMWKV